MKKIYINLILLSNILLSGIIIQNNILSMEKDITKSTADNYGAPNPLENVPPELLSIMIINLIESYVNDWDGITDWQIIKKDIAQDLTSKRLISKEILKRLSEINDYEYIESLISQIDERLQNKIKSAIENRREKTAKLIEILDAHIINELHARIINDLNVTANLTDQDWQEIINLIHSGADINAKSQLPYHELTVLDLAIYKHNKNMIKLLINEGARYGKNNLVSAVKVGDIDILKFFIEDKDVDGINNPELINIASYEGYKDIVKLLIDKGVDINLANRYGDTPLIEAATAGHKDIVELLIDNGANVNMQGKSGITPLMRAGLRYKDIAELLINNGANVDMQNNDDMTALIFNIGTITIGMSNIDIAELLINHSNNLNIQDGRGNTALMHATIINKKEIVKLLIDKGVNLDIQDDFGKTALIYASQMGYIEIAELLINSGADLNIKDENGRNALIYAAGLGEASRLGLFIIQDLTYDGSNDIVELLIIKGANVDDNNGNIILNWAKERNYNNIVKLIEDRIS